MGKMLALDIGGTKIAAAVVTESGMLIGRQQVATPRGGAEQLAAVLETLIAPYRHLVDGICGGVNRHYQRRALDGTQSGQSWWAG